MKKAIIILILLFPVISAVGQNLGIVVSRDSYKGLIFSEKIKLDERDTISRWTPTEKDIDTLEKNLNFFFKRVKKSRPKSKDIAFINKNLNNYMRQYAGYISDKGKKMIFVNCFYYEKDDPFTKDWQKKLIRVFDGGKYFWQITYDEDTRSFISFAINGVG